MASRPPRLTIPTCFAADGRGRGHVRGPLSGAPGARGQSEEERRGSEQRFAVAKPEGRRQCALDPVL